METYIGMIAQFPYSRLLVGWLPCNGQLLDVKGHEALFSLIGFRFGGDNKTHFAVPDFRPKNEYGNPIHLEIGDMYNGKPYIPYYICVDGVYPYFD